MMTFTPPRRLYRLGAVAALALAFGTVSATPALAHTRLVSEEKSGGASWVMIIIGAAIGIGIGMLIVFRARRKHPIAAPRTGKPSGAKPSGGKPAGDEPRAEKTRAEKTRAEKTRADEPRADKPDGGGDERGSGE
ncbi:hypothetical protein [Actinomadura sp. 9N407]|uniref:hypothetical protein n=1 Tax=Actinomadura sp. 9N407 TaxID=3375154 RepID=UPI0037BA10CC